ncbi:hypothetical protein BKA64DRAFT_708181 [Cadophora sp. MPI-SDFR-AT-0126]|nr:hypothetical protein BKA64DRAFT_708181 [Leotiomycetes sp. MPI-SDFR-AT-0126]
MAYDIDTLRILPDDDPNKSDSQIYTQVARTIILSGQVDLLSLSQPSTKETVVPSWVPDRRAEEILRPSGQLPWDTAFKAFTKNLEGINPTSCPKGPEESWTELHLREYQVDVIEELGEQWTPDYLGGCSGEEHPPMIATYFNDINELCSKADQKRIPVADQEQYAIGFVLQAEEESDKGYDDLVQDIAGVVRGPIPTTSTPIRSESGMAYRNMLGWQHDRQPFLSEKGYVGLAPVNVRTGDTIVLFENAKFPYILWEMEDGRYEFRGEAYVHGIMYGEFISDKTGDKEMRNFILV